MSKHAVSLLHINHEHRLRVHFSNFHTTAYVDATNGDVVITATTKEESIAKHLYSTSDKSAAQNIGRIVAHRMIMSGITKVTWDIGSLTYHGKVI